MIEYDYFFELISISMCMYRVGMCIETERNMKYLMLGLDQWIHM